MCWMLVNSVFIQFANEKPVGFSLFLCMCVCIIEWFNEAKCENVRFLQQRRSTEVFPHQFFISFIAPRTKLYDHYMLRYYPHAVSSHMNFKYFHIFKTFSIEHATIKKEQKQNHMTTTSWKWEREKKQTNKRWEKQHNEQAPKRHPIHIESIIFHSISFFSVFHFFLSFCWKLRLWSRIIQFRTKNKLNA